MEEKRIVWTTELVESTKKKLDDGFILKNIEIPYFEKKTGLRKRDCTFKFSQDELDEYTKCKLDIRYFANNYCFIKSEDGSFKVMRLRDYQYDILDLYNNNKSSILMASRQVGKTVCAGIYILHFMLFNNDKNVIIAANKLDTAEEVLDKVKNIYSYLPYFLKQGIDVWNVKQIKFENGCRAKAFAMTKNSAIGNAADLVYLDEFAHIPTAVQNKFYKSVYPTLAAIENSKIIITSTPDGYDLFHKLLIDAEREETDPQKNSFGSLRVMWYQVPGRNVTYIKVNEHLLPQNYLTLDMVESQCKEMYNPNDEKEINGLKLVELKTESSSKKKIIHIQNTEILTYEDICKTEFVNTEGELIHVAQFAQVTTWKMDATKDIGGEDNFAQEYDLRFVAGSKSVLSEVTIERMMKNKKKFEHQHFDEFKKLRWDWSSLKFLEDFDESRRRSLFGMMSIDISEGLGQDYSVINIFELDYKPMKLIEDQKERFSSIQDFFQLKQIGTFRSNIISHDQLAQMAYILIFEFFDPDKMKVVVEYNNDGKAFLQSIKGVFENENNYAGYPILKFKHRIDSTERKKGLKVGPLKNKYVRSYQERMESQEFLVYDEVNIKECGSFIAHTTTAGNTVYKGDGSHDDLAMTLVNMSQGWDNPAFKEMVNDYHSKKNNALIEKMIREILNKEGVSTGTDYAAFFRGKQNAKYSSGKIDLGNLF